MAFYPSVDSLDTLLIMGMKEEFDKGREWVSNNLDMSTMVSILGGLSQGNSDVPVVPVRYPPSEESQQFAKTKFVKPSKFVCSSFKGTVSLAWNGLKVVWFDMP